MILKAQRENAKTPLDKATTQGASAVTIDSGKVEPFLRSMMSLLTSAETPA